MTNTDTQFAARFPGLNPTAFVMNQTTLPGYVPAESPITPGLFTDIGRATAFAPDLQDNFYARFMSAPLPRGDAAMALRIGELTSRVYDPLAPDTSLFNAQRPSAITDVARKNLSRQIALEVNDRLLKQYCQTEQMIGSTAAAIMATMNACFRDDMWVACKEFFSGSARSAPAASQYILTHNPDEEGFAEEMTEKLWDFAENKFAFKSTLYNATGYNTKSESVAIAMHKSAQFPAFKKYYADTFNPSFLKLMPTIDYVDDFATQLGAPEEAGELLATIVDTRAYDIIPMPDPVSTESFRNPARKSTAFFTTYEYAMQVRPFFNIAYIYKHTTSNKAAAKSS